MGKARKMAVESLHEESEKCETKIKAVKAAYEKAKAEMAKMVKGIEPKYEKDLKAYLSEQTKKIEMDMGRMDSRISRVENIKRRFRAQATGAPQQHTGRRAP